MSEPMKDGEGELSLEQATKSVEEWSVYSDNRPLVGGRLLEEIVRLKMAIEMVAADDAFFSQYQGDNPDGSTGKHDSANPKLCLLMNDVWSWASADGENVEWEDVPSIYALWKEQGSDGLLVWACKKRNTRPQKPLFDKLKPEIQAQLKDLPRAGDVVVPVGDGKAAVFDDGWKKEPKP